MSHAPKRHGKRGDDLELTLLSCWRCDMSVRGSQDDFIFVILYSSKDLVIVILAMTTDPDERSKRAGGPRAGARASGPLTPIIHDRTRPEHPNEKIRSSAVPLL